MFFTFSCTKEKSLAQALNLPDLTLTDDYVSAVVCSECHAEADKWKESHISCYGTAMNRLCVRTLITHPLKFWSN